MTQESAERPADRGRREILSHLRHQLIGPADGAGEVVEEPPNRRYSMGVLYPTRIAMDSLEKEEMPDVSGAASGRRSSDDDPIRMATEWFPSSAGVSFQVAAGSDVSSAVLPPEAQESDRHMRQAIRTRRFTVHLQFTEGAP